MKTKPFHFVLIVFVLMGSLLLTSCGNSTKYDGNGNVIEAEDVLKNLGNAVVIDARSAEKYSKGHLAGAVHFPASRLVAKSIVKSMLPEKSAMEMSLGMAGIKAEDTVYIYDDYDGVYASWIWWVMKSYGHQQVKVVNGGANALVKAGGQVVKEPTEIPPSDYKAGELNQTLMATLEEIKGVSQENSAAIKVIDTRTAAESAEFYLPNSILYSHTKNMYKDHTFMSPRDIKLFYQDLGLGKDDAIVVCCRTTLENKKEDMRMAQTALLLKEAGFTNVRIFSGVLPTDGTQQPVKPLKKSDGS